MLCIQNNKLRYFIGDLKVTVAGTLVRSCSDVVEYAQSVLHSFDQAVSRETFFEKRGWGRVWEASIVNLKP